MLRPRRRGYSTQPAVQTASAISQLSGVDGLEAAHHALLAAVLKAAGEDVCEHFAASQRGRLGAGGGAGGAQAGGEAHAAGGGTGGPGGGGQAHALQGPALRAAHAGGALRSTLTLRAPRTLSHASSFMVARALASLRKVCSVAEILMGDFHFEFRVSSFLQHCGGSPALWDLPCRKLLRYNC